MPRKTSPSIVNVAWVGQGDYGDELMAYAIRRLLKRHGVNTLAYYQSGRESMYRGEIDLDIVRWHNFSDPKFLIKAGDWLKLKKIRAILFGGGSILHSENSIRWKLALLGKIPHLQFAACLGVSLGPFKSAVAEQLCGQFLDALSAGVWRDSWSYELSSKISKNQNFEASLDVALALPRLAPDEFNAVLEIKPETNTVGVALVQKKYADDKLFIDALKLINALTEKYQKVLLFSLYTGEAYGDAALNRRLRQEARRGEAIEIHDFDGDIFKTLRLLRRSSLIIGMRLHAIISAYLLNIPFISLAYHPKNTYFTRSIRYPNELAFETESGIPTEAVLTALDLIKQNPETLFKTVKPRADATEAVFLAAARLAEKLAKTIAL